MGELRSYVDTLFKGYARNKKIEDLRAEILSNLEAKKEDLISSGMEEKAAIVAAKNSITTIEGLIDENKQIFVNQFTSESLQDALLYTVIAWITTIPMLIFKNFFMINWVMIIAVILLGYNYYIRVINKSQQFINEKNM